MKKYLKISLYITFKYCIFDRLGQFYTMTNIGDIIRLKRIEMGISQKELASQISVDVSFLCKIEKNEKKITLNKLNIIAEKLQLSIDEMKLVYYKCKVDEILNCESKKFNKNFLNYLVSIYK
ncbi:helix-turn-helix domain-containing protein [Bergeyella porcorum]|uniref:helix-turn-helix domain-containing protein n=1 Tax=Bergeyella porcorum TaxID=1735111 RepID=UPI0035ED682B